MATRPLQIKPSGSGDVNDFWFVKLALGAWTDGKTSGERI